MDANNNRLHLNFGNERLPLPNDRTYPTTPSTFPQPVFPPNAAGQQTAAMQQQAYGTAGYAPQGYFAQGQYQQQQAPPLPQQPQYPVQAAGYEYNNIAAAGGAQFQQARSNTPGNDPNTSLAHQFSHQNLGGAARQAPYAPRSGAQAQRPRTAGGSAQQQGPYNNYSNVPLPTQGALPVSEFQPIPERNPDKYGTNANSNQKKCSQLAADFFKDSVKRARERNQRYDWHTATWT